jgi:hypothetical protein
MDGRVSSTLEGMVKVKASIAREDEEDVEDVEGGGAMCRLA